VHTRGASIVDTHVCFQSAPQYDLVALKRNGNGQKLAAQKDERRTPLARGARDVGSISAQKRSLLTLFI
jgi:hypothetical protein